MQTNVTPLTKPDMVRAAETPVRRESAKPAVERAPPAPVAVSAPPPPAPALNRLVIEKGPMPGSFVYTTIDRNTGEIIRQVPREEVIRMRDRPSPSPGSVADIQA